MKIKKLEIKNFKLFNEKFNSIADIADTSLILFNGPNGYGKTTIFDAIEFALTGRIKRIVDYSNDLGIKKRECYDKKILVADAQKESYVKLAVEEENCKIELQRIYTPSASDGKKFSIDNNPYKIFEKFNRKILFNGQEILDLEEQDRILEKYHLSNIEEFFDKCCFLSQDEHLQFLKEAKSEKVAGLDFIFKIPNEFEMELRKIDNILSHLQNKNFKNDLGYIKKLENKKKELSDEIEEVEEAIKKANVSEREELKYYTLFGGKSIEWDKKNPILNIVKFDESMVEIEKLVYFAENQAACENFIFNKQFKDLLKPFKGNGNINCENDVLEYAYRYYSLIQSEEMIEDRYNSQRQLKVLKEKIKKRDINNINWKVIESENLLDEDAIKNAKEEIRQVKDLKKSQGLVSTAITNITDARLTLMGYAKDAMNQSVIEDNRCPLCGASYDNRQNLEDKITEKEEKLQLLCDKFGIDIKNKVDGMYNRYLNNILIRIESKLNDAIAEDMYQKIQEVKKNKGKIYEVKNLLQKINVILPEQYQDDITEIAIGYAELVQDIKNNLREISQETEEQLIAKDFVHKYDWYYDKEVNKFKETTSDLLRTKQKYIKAMFYYSNVQLLSEKNEELIKANNRLDKLNKIYAELRKYRDTIQNGVKKYKRKIIDDIEPLLHVYTAKILQQKFNGRSIFIMLDDDMKSLQLVNSAPDNQDILYNMSSGQLAAVSLSFLLCMNQVYAQQQSLPILLIDDPIQTIDDVNMVGLVDILRYEFDNTQIFISTHEQKFEWYLRYKYEKAGKKIKPYNMKKIVLQTSE